MVLAGLLLGGWGHAEEPPARPEAAAVQAFFKKSCLDCHDAETKRGDWIWKVWEPIFPTDARSNGG